MSSSIDLDQFDSGEANCMAKYEIEVPRCESQTTRQQQNQQQIESGNKKRNLAQSKLSVTSASTIAIGQGNLLALNTGE